VFAVSGVQVLSLDGCRQKVIGRDLHRASRGHVKNQLPTQLGFFVGRRRRKKLLFNQEGTFLLSLPLLLFVRQGSVPSDPLLAPASSGLIAEAVRHQ